MPRLIDTHAHIADAQFANEHELVLKRAKECGIDLIVEIADAPAEWPKVLELTATYPPADPAAAAQYPKLYWSCGFHPHYAAETDGFDFKMLKASAALPKCVAVGEIGLDYYKSRAPREKQIELFKKSLEVTLALQKPVVIHSRQAEEDMIKIIEEYYQKSDAAAVPAGVIHCFSGSLDFAQRSIARGFMIGVDGPITYPSAQSLRDVIAQVPLDRIVLETDSPYLPPQNFRGKRNEPGHLTYIAEKMGELFLKSAEEIASITSRNALRLYRLEKEISWQN